MLTPWTPVRGYLQSGRFNYGAPYTIRKPTHLLKAKDGTVLGAIQWLRGTDGVLQVGTDKPMDLTSSLLYDLTNYGNGWDRATAQDRVGRNFESAAFYCLGPDNEDLIAAVEAVEKVREFQS